MVFWKVDSTADKMAAMKALLVALSWADLKVVYSVETKVVSKAAKKAGYWAASKDDLQAGKKADSKVAL